MLPKMGYEFVKQPGNRSLNERDQKPLRRIYLRMDLPIILATVCLLLFGLIMVYSASADFSFYISKDRSIFSIYSIFLRQVLALALALCAAPVIILFDYHAWKKFLLPAVGVVIFLLLLVLFIGENRYGSRRGLFGGAYQPAELAKFMTVVYVAFWLDSHKEDLKKSFMPLFALVGILSIMGAFIIMQPDYSAVLTILVIGGILFYLAGADWKQISFLMMGVIIGGLLIVLVTSTGRARVSGWFQGLSDPTAAPYQVQRTLEAFYSGGFFGVGLGQSVTKGTGMPTPHSDSIYAIVGEEFGLLGTIFLLGLYLVILWRGLAISQRAPDNFGMLLSAGMAIWLVMEALINMAQIVNLMPYTGNALPFLSAGGSNLFISVLAIATIMNVSIRSENSKGKNDELFSKVVDLRRWNRRGRVSRTRRPANPAQ